MLTYSDIIKLEINTNFLLNLQAQSYGNPSLSQIITNLPSITEEGKSQAIIFRLMLDPTVYLFPYYYIHKILIVNRFGLILFYLPGSSVPLRPIPLLSLFPVNTNNYYRYQGSLTTPPCLQVVQWTIFSETAIISEKQVCFYN